VGLKRRPEVFVDYLNSICEIGGLDFFDKPVYVDCCISVCCQPCTYEPVVLIYAMSDEPAIDGIGRLKRPAVRMPDAESQLCCRNLVGWITTCSFGHVL